jgi:hypothetical protein
MSFIEFNIDKDWHFCTVLRFEKRMGYSDNHVFVFSTRNYVFQGPGWHNVFRVWSINVIFRAQGNSGLTYRQLIRIDVLLRQQLEY